MAKGDRDSFDDDYMDDQDDGFMTFDARDDDEDRSRGPLIIVAIVAVLALCGIISWKLISDSRSAGDTPEVAADPGSFKSAPAALDASATPPVTDADKGVYDAASGASAPALDIQPATGAEDPLLADGSAAPSQAPPPVVAPAAVPKPAPRPVVKPAESKVASVPQIAQAAPRAAAPVASNPVAAPKPKAPVVSAPAPAPAAKTEGRSAGFAAQLGSFQNRASAESALARYRATGLSGAVGIVPVDLGAKGTWYRIRATGFDSRAEVEGFCSVAKSAGAQCIPASR